MKYHDMQKPLVQSALVLLAILVVIGFVAGSGAESFFGGIVSILKGVVYTVLFAFALIIGLIFSVVLLIAIFLGAISLYSSEKAKEMYANLRQRSSDLYLSWTNRPQRQQASSSSSPDQKNTAYSSSPQQERSQYATASSLMNLEQKLSSEVVDIKKIVDTLNAKSSSLDTSFTSMQETVSALPGSDIIQRIEQLELQQEKLGAKLEECLRTFEKMSKTTGLEEENKKLSKDISAVQGEIALVTKDLGELRTLFSETNAVATVAAKEPTASAQEEEYRIFAYLEKDTDKTQVIKYVAEAVEKNMTYAEMDSFFAKSLPKKVNAILKDHPSLTKEYIRSCKNS